MFQLTPGLVLLLVVAIIYAMFDVFNKRNVPNVFVYVTTVIAFLFAIVYSTSTITVALLVALVVLCLGYFIYKTGFLGAGDVAEFVFISLVMPFQQATIEKAPYQFGLPFILSVLISAGLAAIIFIPIYYLIIKKSGKGLALDAKDVFKGMSIFIAYLVLILCLVIFVKAKAVSIIIVMMIALPSAIMLIFEKRIYLGMVEFVYPKELEPEDMIATNMMKREDMLFFKRKSEGFGRLVTASVLQKIKSVKKKVPVYRNSVPFALFVLIGIVIALFFGNIVLLILF